MATRRRTARSRGARVQKENKKRPARRGRAASRSKLESPKNEMKETTDNPQCQAAEAALKELDLQQGATVEQYLHAYVDRLAQELQQRTEGNIKEFQAAFTAVKQKKVEGHRSSSEPDVEARVVSVVRLRCTEGPYSGKQFVTRPCKDGSPVLIGRSSGRKFRYGGVCLARDKEVSTTHGKIEMQTSGAICFVDAQSTNGSCLNGTAIEPNTLVQLTAGDTLTVGPNSSFEILFEYAEDGK